MSKTIIFFGSTTGTCEDIAKRIATKLNGAEVKNASELSAETIAEYELILLGSSTWGAGELQDDWFSPCELLKTLNLAGKRVALFSVGDYAAYGDTFCGALAPLYEAVKNTGAKIVGQVSTDGYTFDASEGVIDGEFVGLALDESNEPEKTDARIDAWLSSL